MDHRSSQLIQFPLMLELASTLSFKFLLFFLFSDQNSKPIYCANQHRKFYKQALISLCRSKRYSNPTISDIWQHYCNPRLSATFICLLILTPLYQCSKKYPLLANLNISQFQSEPLTMFPKYATDTLMALVILFYSQLIIAKSLKAIDGVLRQIQSQTAPKHQQFSYKLYIAEVTTRK